MSAYATKEARITVRGAGTLLIRSLQDRQQYADPLGEAEAMGISSATWPLFGVLWPSALQLAALMAARPVNARERILEVGCGLALASLVCHRRGADVTASDCHPLAGQFLYDNVTRNGLPPLAYRHGNWHGDWRDDRHGDPPRDPQSSAIADSTLQGRFDLIMGSDVLYERDETGALARFIEHHALPTAQVLIVDPDRSNRPAFTGCMAAQGFTLAETALRTPEADGLPYKGRLLHYTRNQPR